MKRLPKTGEFHIEITDYVTFVVIIIIIIIPVVVENEVFKSDL